MNKPRVLFLADPSPDYVADGLFHGLRELLGPGVVDWPRRDAMYVDATDLGGQYGRGFGFYGLLPEIPVDREAVFDRDWDLVVTAVLWRDWGYWRQAWDAFGPRTHHAVVDGGDMPWAYPYGPAWWRPWRWTLPRAHTRATYFKREWGNLTMLAAGRRMQLEPLAISYPREKIVPAPPAKSKDFGSHVVDLELGELLGHRLANNRAHIFHQESEYLADLRASWFGVTTKRAGWDALRHLEIAAAGAIPCFRNLENKPATCAPYGLLDGHNCLSYSHPQQLLERVAGISLAERSRLGERALAWARANSTESRAESFLERAL